MILTHFGINNQTFTNGGAVGTSVRQDTLVKSHYSFTMHGMYAVVLPEKIKNSVCHLALDYILHGFI
jgi:hypothetical protein